MQCYPSAPPTAACVCNGKCFLREQKAHGNFALKKRSIALPAPNWCNQIFGHKGQVCCCFDLAGGGGGLTAHESSCQAMKRHVLEKHSSHFTNASQWIKACQRILIVHTSCLLTPIYCADHCEQLATELHHYWSRRFRRLWLSISFLERDKYHRNVEISHSLRHSGDDLTYTTQQIELLLFISHGLNALGREAKTFEPKRDLLCIPLQGRRITCNRLYPFYFIWAQKSTQPCLFPPPSHLSLPAASDHVHNDTIFYYTGLFNAQPRCELVTARIDLSGSIGKIT